MTPGRKFSITTSALAASRCTISIDFGLVRSSARKRLLALMPMNPVDRLRADQSLLGGPAAHVVPAGALDLDDVGAEQRQLVAAEGPGEHLREIEDADAGEGLAWG